MATRNQQASTTTAQRWIAAALVASSVVLCGIDSAQAEESTRSSAGQLTVSTVVAARCEVGTASLQTDTGTVTEMATAADALSLKCARGVTPRTEVAYENVAQDADPSGRRLVVTVDF